MTQPEALLIIQGIALDLPETSQGDFGEHQVFKVRSKTFVWLLDNHHGDGILGIVVKAPAEVNEQMVKSDPEKYYLPAYMTHIGWVGMRLDRGNINLEEIRDLILESYRLIAPKILAKQIN